MQLYQKMIAFTGIFQGIRQQVYFSGLVEVQMHKKQISFFLFHVKCF